MSNTELVKVTYDQKKAYIQLKKLYKSLPTEEKKPLSLANLQGKMPAKDYFKLVSTQGTIGETNGSKARIFSQFVDFNDKEPAEAVENVFTKQLDAITYEITGVTNFSDFKANPLVFTYDKLKDIYSAFITLNGVSEFMSDYTKSKKCSHLE